MIAFLLLVAVAYGIRYVVNRKPTTEVHTDDTRTTWAVDRLSGDGWSLVAVDVKGPLHVINLDDPSVDVEIDVALALNDHDVN